MNGQDPEKKEAGGAGRRGCSGFLPWLMPLMAAAAIIAILIFLPGRGERGSRVSPVTGIVPPESTEIGFAGHPEIDTLIAAGSRAFASKDYFEAERLLTRARFFVQSGINVGEIKGYPAGLSFFAGLSAFYRGYPEKGIPMIEEEIERDPGGAMYLYYLASIRLAGGRGEEAGGLLERAAAAGGPYGALAAEKLEKLR